MIARNGEQLKDAIIKKFEYRESNDKLNNIEEIMQAIRDDEGLKSHWNNYQSKYTYAEDISYEDTIRIIQAIVDIVVK